MKVTIPINLVLQNDKVTSDAGTTGDPAVWAGGTTYYEGDIVQVASTSKRYQAIYTNLAGFSGGSSPEVDVLAVSPKWAEIGYINKWKMFDHNRDEPTYKAASPLTLILTPDDRVDCVALLGMSGVTDILITAVDGLGTNVYNPTSTHYASSNIANYIVYNFPPNSDIVITIVLSGGGTIGCTTCLIGSSETLGTLQSDVVRDSVNFSRIDRDTYGLATMVRRRSVPKINYSLITTAGEVDRVLTVRNQLNAVPALWCGLDDPDTVPEYYNSLIILGFYRTFSIQLDNSITATIQLELEEI